jgi:prepilin-type processing-associated H-X9-DG protein
MYCPTRRRVTLYPITSNAVAPWSYCNTITPVARCDYAACCGDTTLPNDIWDYSSVTPYSVVDNNPATYWTAINAPYITLQNKPPLSLDGISYRGSEVKMSDITDGASYTYMLGEKYIDVDEYNTGWSWGDDQCAYIGWDQDNHRISLATYQGLLFPPMQDVPGFDDEKIYGSAHFSGFNMAFCDGSVTTINYSIDPETHRRLGTRAEGLPVNTKAF